MAGDSDSEHRSRLTYAVTTGGQNFSINDNGQLKTKILLDRETTASYDLVVTATDPSAGTDTINITVNVEDVSEPPMITGPTKALPWMEGGTDINRNAVAVYTATDSETTEGC